MTQEETLILVGLHNETTLLHVAAIIAAIMADIFSLLPDRGGRNLQSYNVTHFTRFFLSPGGRTHPCLKPFVAPFLSTQLTVPGSPGMTLQLM